ncbi:hypothetical protein [Streptomyces sp. NPDC001642]|uniref:hypothetical protein n=1 Tax=Streptomyces sp. NPDC001642 TaxID=3154392 RepID=UPI003329477F
MLVEKVLPSRTRVIDTTVLRRLLRAARTHTRPPPSPEKITRGVRLRIVPTGASQTWAISWYEVDPPGAARQ